MSRLRFQSAFETPKTLPRKYENWLVKYKPKQVSEVAIDGAKATEIRQALNTAVVTVLSGPAGSSKSTIVENLCKEQNKTLLEFRAPESALSNTTSIIDSFSEFMTGCTYYNRETTVIMIDDLPNVLHEPTRQLFEEEIVGYARSAQESTPKLVLCFTEIECPGNYQESILVSKIVPKLVALDAGKCIHVKTNAVNQTLINKCLTRILQNENLRVDKSLTQSLKTCGDIRQAIITLELACRPPHLRSIPSSLLPQSVHANFFHAVNKIIYNSKDPGSIEPAVAQYKDSMSMFTLTLLENIQCAKHQRLKLETASESLDLLSISDLVPGIGTECVLSIKDLISESEPEHPGKGRYLATKFTSYNHFSKQEQEKRAQLKFYARNERKNGVVNLLDAALEYLPYRQALPKKLDIEFSDSESDFDF